MTLYGCNRGLGAQFYSVVTQRHHAPDRHHESQYHSDTGSCGLTSPSSKPVKHLGPVVYNIFSLMTLLMANLLAVVA